MNKQETLDRFEVLLAKLYAARTTEAAEKIFANLVELTNLENGSVNEELEDMAANIYMKMLERENVCQHAERKLTLMAQLMSDQRRKKLAQEFLKEKSDHSTLTKAAAIATGVVFRWL